MKYKLSNLFLLIIGFFIVTSCSENKGDVTKDPKYAGIANSIFITQAPLYYYHYTHSDGHKSGYFLSSQSGVPNAELKAEIPVGGHVKISKVYEVPQKNGEVQVTVKGEVFSSPTGEALEYMATYEDIQSSLRQN